MSPMIYGCHTHSHGADTSRSCLETLALTALALALSVAQQSPKSYFYPIYAEGATNHLPFLLRVLWTVLEEFWIPVGCFNVTSGGPLFG